MTLVISYPISPETDISASGLKTNGLIWVYLVDGRYDIEINYLAGSYVSLYSI